MTTWARAIAAAVVACAAVSCDWPWQHDMANQPSRPAGAGPRSPVRGTLPVHGELVPDRDTAERQLHSPIPASAPVERGRRLYGVYCEPCHGASGRGGGPVAREFAPPMGDLTSDAVQSRGDGWLYATIVNGTDTMPRYGHELEPAERWEIVHFVRTLARNGR